MLTVVVRTRDEAPRLRLTLASLAEQVPRPEVVVVDDGSVDDTAGAIAGAPLPVIAIRHDRARGRAAATNAGAAAATGAVLLFLDGDTLAAPGTVAAHLAGHAARPGSAGRGETWHLRCTRFLRDPAAGTPWPDQADRIATLPAAERTRMMVTPMQVATNFAAIAARGAPGIYPGAGPAALHALEMAALRDAPGCALLWAAASGSNLSVSRTAFAQVGGFDPALDINEHRELALRLTKAGVRMIAVEGARTYHLVHRAGWRDPLVDRGWEARFRARHPDAPIDLLIAFWRGLSERGGPIASLPALARAAGLA